MAIRLDKARGTGVEIWYRLQVVVKAERDLFRLKREMFKGRSWRRRTQLLRVLRRCSPPEQAQRRLWHDMRLLGTGPTNSGSMKRMPQAQLFFHRNHIEHIQREMGLSQPAILFAIPIHCPNTSRTSAGVRSSDSKGSTTRTAPNVWPCCRSSVSRTSHSQVCAAATMRASHQERE